jgi:hypothetical protein
MIHHQSDINVAVMQREIASDVAASFAHSHSDKSQLLSRPLPHCTIAKWLLRATTKRASHPTTGCSSNFGQLIRVPLAVHTIASGLPNRTLSEKTS